MLLFKRIVGVLLGAITLVVALLFSIVIFAVILVIVAIAIGYLWWKTRALRRQMRERPPGGHVIDGEVIRDKAKLDSAHTSSLH